MNIIGGYNYIGDRRRDVPFEGLKITFDFFPCDLPFVSLQNHYNTRGGLIQSVIFKTDGIEVPSCLIA
jgi:hypothetical protein